MTTKPASSIPGIWLRLLIGAVILAAAVVSVIFLVGFDPSGEGGSGLSSNFDFDIEKYKKVDPKLIRYRQVAEYPVGERAGKAIAVGPDDAIFLAVEDWVLAFSRSGTIRYEIQLSGPATCLAVGNSEHAHPGRLYAGVGDHVELITPGEDRAPAWPSPGEKAVLTSIAVAEEDVFVADAGNRVVWRYNVEGELVGKIGEPDADGGVDGFVIPGGDFDVAVTPDQLLRVVNPGARRIEAFTFDGDPMVRWGESGPAIDRFFGCCNPSHMCVLPDGRIVTAEKGLPRIKVYAIDGKFESVVAGPEQLTPTETKAVETRTDHQMKVFDVAADSRGRVLVLDPHRRSVRVFEEK